ncbi:ATP-binding cassette domain-containing protein [Chromobacterium vaccinii]|uniref:ATP-binding cassette domain-containing protein n=1 Tax=Chromobacterium vaccinii TaxID=1108595 RepID=UPI000E166E2C|nr:ABC transporter ATP-binding protein [Chromobacterium vaccinii]SUX30565.1 Lipid A export ATP-binding/permease protein MsbA [Chromobacterium vaccinii]
MRKYLRDIDGVMGRRVLAIVLGISFLITSLEAASISAVVPALGIILGKGVPGFAADIFKSIGIGSATSQSLIIMLIVAGVFLARGAFLSMATWMQSSLVFNVQRTLSDRLFKSFMNAKFERITTIASSTVIRTSTTELANIILGGLLPLAALMSELAIVVGSVLVLFVVEPFAALVLLLAVFVLTLPIVWLNRRRLGALGKSRHTMEEDRVRLAQELVSGIREIKVYGLKEQLLELITSTNERYSKVMVYINFLQNFPRVYFETMGVCALLLTCSLQLGLGRSSQDVLMFLSLAAFAAFRTLPSIAKILSSLQAVRFFHPSITAYRGLIEYLDEDAMKVETRTIISENSSVNLKLVDAGYKYPDCHTWIFNGVSFTLNAGQFVGLTGPSGVGKSTMLDCLIGLRSTTTGEVKITHGNNNNIGVVKIAYVPQVPVILEGTIGRNIVLGNKGEQEPDNDSPLLKEALAMSGLDIVMKKGGLTLSSYVVEGGRNLSGGQRQRLALARALYLQADILVLDEATSALDAESERKIFEDIRKNNANKIIIMVAHRTELLKFCDSIINFSPIDGVSVIKIEFLQNDYGYN